MLETLYVVTCVANPLLWQSRENLARVAISDWLKEPNVAIYLAECAYGSRGYQLADLAGPRVTHIPLRATTMAWSKENLLNIAILTPMVRRTESTLSGHCWRCKIHADRAKTPCGHFPMRISSEFSRVLVDQSPKNCTRSPSARRF
jgi:hypothetical protein